MDFVNLRLLSHPVNWVVVWIVLALALIGYGAIHDGLARNTSAA